jgi:hypothetical protein
VSVIEGEADVATTSSHVVFYLTRVLNMVGMKPLLAAVRA